jgi:hypothetical protein
LLFARFDAYFYQGECHMSSPAQVDSKVPRGKAAFHTLLPALAFLLSAASLPAGRLLVGATGLAMAVSVVGGPRFSVFGKLFNKVIRPALRIGPGSPEDVAPHRFAEAIGAVCLLAAFALLWVLETAGWAIVLLVVALAALNWLAGICVGCQLYLLGARLLGRKATV